MKLKVANSIKQNDKYLVEVGLKDHAKSQGFPWDDQELGVFFYDDQDQIKAGLIAETVWK